MYRFLFFIASVYGSLESMFAVDSSIIQSPDGVILVTGDSSVGLISSAITYGIGLAAIIGVMGITWWGIQMILSVGEDEKRKKAKNTIIYAIIGVVVAGLAYGIVSLIGNFRI